jgi:hypothetical protein
MAMARVDRGLSHVRKPHSCARGTPNLSSLNLLPYPLPPASMPLSCPHEHVQAGGARRHRRVQVGQVAATGERAGAAAAVRTSMGVGIRPARNSGKPTSARWCGRRRHARGLHGCAALR